MLLTDCDLICFDFETTGVSAMTDRIIDMGAVRFTTDRLDIDTYSQLVNPLRPIGAAASQVHGLYDHDVYDAPTLDNVLPQFLQFLQGAEVLIAHNAGFDRSFLAAACVFAGASPPETATICTLPLTRKAWPEFENYRLETIGVNLGLIEREDHRGLSDSLLLTDVFRLAVEKLQIKTKEELYAFTKPHLIKDNKFKAGTAPQGFELFERAIKEKKDMAIQYGDYARSFRTITPEQIFENGNRTYLLANCHRDGFTKQFRFDRIHEFHLLTH